MSVEMTCVRRSSLSSVLLQVFPCLSLDCSAYLGHLGCLSQLGCTFFLDENGQVYLFCCGLDCRGLLILSKRLSPQQTFGDLAVKVDLTGIMAYALLLVHVHCASGLF